jgi:hypothetical protein
MISQSHPFISESKSARTGAKSLLWLYRLLKGTRIIIKLRAGTAVNMTVTPSR